jgi:hypothetical protein
MQNIWVLLKIFQILPMQLLEDFDIVVALRAYIVALLAYIVILSTYIEML